MRKLVLLAGFILTASAVAAQPFWEKKDPTQWSKNDCRKMTEDSPWAKKEVVFSAVVGDRFGQPTRGENRQTEQHIFYIVQFRSAKPVRQAVVREAAIQNNYDKLTPQQKKSFDAQTSGYVNQTFSDSIVLYVEYGSNVQFFEHELTRFWHEFTLTKFHEHVYLTTSSGQRVAPTEWKHAPGSEPAFQLVFPRLIDNEPWIRESDKWVKLEFPHPRFDELRQDVDVTRSAAQVTAGAAQQTAIATFEFKVEKMKLNGVLAY